MAVGIMCGRSSRIDDHETKAGAKVVRMCWWNSRIVGCKTRAVVKTVGRMHRRCSCNDGRMRQQSSRTTRAMVKAVRKGAPMMLSHWWMDATMKLLHWWLRDEGSGKGSQKDAPMVVEQGLRRGEEQSSGLSADSRRLINDETANAWVRCTPRGEEYDAAICFEP